MLNKLLNKLRPAKEETSQPFRRSLTPVQATELAKHLSTVFDDDISGQRIKAIITEMNRLEQSMIGRVAGDVDDHALNYLMRYYSTLKLADSVRNPAQLEIGTLFGGSLLMTLAAIKDTGCEVKAVCIDPLNGYYATTNDPYSSEVDILTKLPVDRPTLETNVINAGFDLDDVEIIQALSWETEAIERCKEYDILAVWIDGDHSYEGLKKDWGSYAPQVVAGGFVLIDNYNDKFWPDVTRFVDDEVLPQLNEWRVACLLNRSILFQKCVKPRTERLGR